MRIHCTVMVHSRDSSIRSKATCVSLWFKYLIGPYMKVNCDNAKEKMYLDHCFIFCY